jgi:sortase (surface protein transpeptidase)
MKTQVEENRTNQLQKVSRKIVLAIALFLGTAALVNVQAATLKTAHSKEVTYKTKGGKKQSKAEKKEAKQKQKAEKKEAKSQKKADSTKAKK